MGQVRHGRATNIRWGHAKIAALEAVEKGFGVKGAQFEIRAIAADGNRVLAERLGHFQQAAGSTIGASRAMGIFKIENDRSIAWRDCYDVNAAKS